MPYNNSFLREFFFGLKGIFSQFNKKQWEEIIILSAALGYSLLWLFLFSLMFFFDKVNVLEPNLFVRIIEMVFFVALIVLVVDWVRK